MDREKVIKQLEVLIEDSEYSEIIDLTPDDAKSILELLKEQEAVEPYVTGRGETFETAETWWYACGNCHEALDVNDKYCRHCGRSVKWE